MENAFQKFVGTLLSLHCILFLPNEIFLAYKSSWTYVVFSIYGIFRNNKLWQAVCFTFHIGYNSLVTALYR